MVNRDGFEAWRKSKVHRLNASSTWRCQTCGFAKARVGLWRCLAGPLGCATVLLEDLKEGALVGSSWCWQCILEYFRGIGMICWFCAWLLHTQATPVSSSFSGPLHRLSWHFLQWHGWKIYRPSCPASTWWSCCGLSLELSGMAWQVRWR